MKNSFPRIDLRSELSLVIITQNRSADLARTLKHLTELPEQVNIIVVDNASTDRTPIMVKSVFPEVTLIELKENMLAVGRNIGVEAATTPYVAFSDDDSWWAPYSLEQGLNYLKQYPQVGAIAARILVNEEHKPDPINKYFETSPLPQIVPMPGPALMGFLECAVIMRREAYRAAGGYNPKLSFSGEGALLAIDLVSMGWAISYAADIVAYHYPSSIREMNTRYRMGARNAIWRAWLRRPLKSALSETARQISLGFKDKNMMYGVADSLRGIPFILKNRRVVSEIVEYQIKLLDKQRDNLEKKTNNLQAAVQTQFGF